MSILVDGVIFGSQGYGGISRMWYEILSRLPEWGVKINLISPYLHRNPFLKELIRSTPSIKIYPDLLYWPFRYFQRPEIRSKVLKTLYLSNDVRIFHSSYFTTIYQPKLINIATLYDMTYELFEGSASSYWSNFIIEKKRLALENANAIVCISENTKKDLLHIYPMIDPEKVLVIYVGINPAIPINSVSFQDLAIKYKIPSRPNEYLLFVGNRGGYKNFRIISEWILSQRSPKDITIICVGGEKKDRLITDNLPQRHNFVFTGYVSEIELAVLYRNSLGLIYPSLYEGFGLPVLEAMANNCPVICSSTSSLPEVGGDAAIYFDPHSIESLDNAINLLMVSDRDKLVRVGLLNISRFSWEKSVQSLVELYRRYL